MSALQTFRSSSDKKGNSALAGFFRAGAFQSCWRQRSLEQELVDAAVRRTAERWLEGLFAVTSEEVRQQAQAEGLVLRVADNKTGYFGVYLEKPGQPKPSRRW